MSAKSLSELAASWGLDKLAALLSGADAVEMIDSIADADEGLTAEAQPDPTLKLGLMTRRGLQPALVMGWIETLQSSLERGLAAWDVLAGSLITNRDLLAGLRSFLEPVRNLLPPAASRGACRSRPTRSSTSAPWTITAGCARSRARACASR